MIESTYQVSVSHRGKTFIKNVPMGWHLPESDQLRPGDVIAYFASESTDVDPALFSSSHQVDAFQHWGRGNPNYRISLCDAWRVIRPDNS